MGADNHSGLLSDEEPFSPSAHAGHSQGLLLCQEAATALCRGPSHAIGKGFTPSQRSSTAGHESREVGNRRKATEHNVKCHLASPS